MNSLKFLIILLFGLMFSSCIPAQTGQDYNLEDIIHASTSDDRSSKKRRTRTSKRRSSKECTSDDCEEICEETYEDTYDKGDDDDDDGVIERCLELSKKTLDTFKTILEYLEEPTLRNVRTIKEEYSEEFADMVDVSLSPWVDVAEHVRNREAEALLVFVASSPEIAKALTNASKNYEDYDKYEGVKELAQEAGRARSGCEKYVLGLCGKRISGSYTFSDIATHTTEQDATNTYAQDMVRMIINAECDDRFPYYQETCSGIEREGLEPNVNVEIANILEYPTSSKLETIRSSGFAEYISSKTNRDKLLKLVRDEYSPTEVNSILTWIAKYEDIAEALINENPNDEILNVLLDRLEDQSSDLLIDGSNTFEDLAIESDNEEVLEWIHAIRDCATVRNDPLSEMCLQGYCALAASIDPDNANDLLQFNYFKRYLEKIIREKVNGCENPESADKPPNCHWDTDLINSASGIKGNWWEALCGETTTRPQGVR